MPCCMANEGYEIAIEINKQNNCMYFLNKRKD